jgi:hypothetical protein
VRHGAAIRTAFAWGLSGATQLLFFRYRAAVFGQEEFCYGVRPNSSE